MEFAPMMGDAYVLMRKDELDHLDRVLDAALQSIDSKLMRGLPPVASDLMLRVRSCLEDAHLTTTLLVNFSPRVAHKHSGSHLTPNTGRTGGGQ